MPNRKKGRVRQGQSRVNQRAKRAARRGSGQARGGEDRWITESGVVFPLRGRRRCCHRQAGRLRHHCPEWRCREYFFRGNSTGGLRERGFERIRGEMLAIAAVWNDVQKLIGRQGAGEAHGKVIRRKRRRLIEQGIGVAAKGEDAEGAAKLRSAESFGFLFAEGTKFARALLDDAARKMAGQHGSFCSGARGV